MYGVMFLSNIRIDFFQRQQGGTCFSFADIFGAVDDLALQIRKLYTVIIRNAYCPDAGGSKYMRETEPKAPAPIASTFDASSFFISTRRSHEAQNAWSIVQADLL